MEASKTRIGQDRIVPRNPIAPRPVALTHGVPRRLSARSATDLVRRVLHHESTPVDTAWAAAYAQQDVHVVLDAERLDAGVLGAVDRRQAWQFQVFPLRRERGVLLLVTAERSLVRAARFAQHVCDEPVLLLIAEEAPFKRFLKAYYPFPGVQDVLG